MSHSIVCGGDSRIRQTFSGRHEGDQAGMHIYGSEAAGAAAAFDWAPTAQTVHHCRVAPTSAGELTTVHFGHTALANGVARDVQVPLCRRLRAGSISGIGQFFTVRPTTARPLPKTIPAFHPKYLVIAFRKQSTTRHSRQDWCAGRHQNHGQGQDQVDGDGDSYQARGAAARRCFSRHVRAID